MKADDKHRTGPFAQAQAVMTPSLISARMDAKIRNAQFYSLQTLLCENEMTRRDRIFPFLNSFNGIQLVTIHLIWEFGSLIENKRVKQGRRSV